MDPVKLCCGKKQSEHNGVVCPDGLVMCQLCFEKFPIEELGEEDGKKVDICKQCLEDEQKALNARN